MKFDFNTMRQCNTMLSSKLMNFIYEMQKIESANKAICSDNVWNAKTKDYYKGLFETMKKNFDACVNIENNVENYLDTVVQNYTSFDSGSLL